MKKFIIQYAHDTVANMRKQNPEALEKMQAEIREESSAELRFQLALSSREVLIKKDYAARMLAALFIVELQTRTDDVAKKTIADLYEAEDEIVGDMTTEEQQAVKNYKGMTDASTQPN